MNGANDPAARLAAVLALFVQRQQTNLLFIRRADRGDPWSSDIALPGGHVDPGDADALAAAYRETTEEIGIMPDAITYLGDLGALATHLPGLTVRVFVGLWDGLAPVEPDPVEVSRVFEVPLALLVDLHRRHGYDTESGEALCDRLEYPVNEGAIWGLTARIIHRLLGLVAV